VVMRDDVGAPQLHLRDDVPGGRHEAAVAERKPRRRWKRRRRRSGNTALEEEKGLEPKLFAKTKQAAHHVNGADTVSYNVLRQPFVAILKNFSSGPAAVICAICLSFVLLSVCVFGASTPICHRLPPGPDANIGIRVRAAGDTKGPPSASVRWRVKVVVFFVSFADSCVSTSQISILQQELACGTTPRGGCVDDASMFIIYAIKFIMQMMVNPIVVNNVNKLGPIAPLRCSVIAMASSSAGFGFALRLNSGSANFVTAAFLVLLVARAFQGIASSIVTLAGMTLVHRSHSQEDWGIATGFVLTGLALGAVAGPVASNMLTWSLGAWCSCLCLGGCAALGGIVLTLLLRGGKATIGSEDEEPQDPAYTVWTDPLVLSIAGATAASNGVVALLDGLMALNVSRPFNDLRPQAQGLPGSCLTFIYIVSNPLAGALADRVPKQGLVVSGLIFMSVGVRIVAAVAFLNVNILGLGLCGLGLGFVDTPSASLLMETAGVRRHKTYARSVAMLDIAASAASACYPALAATGQLFHARYMSMSLLVAASCILLAPTMSGHTFDSSKH